MANHSALCFLRVIEFFQPTPAPSTYAVPALLFPIIHKIYNTVIYSTVLRAESSGALALVRNTSTYSWLLFELPIFTSLYYF
jgi:hypothetical protein